MIQFNIGDSMDKIVFTDWHKVIIKNGSYKTEMPENKFLAEMGRNIKSANYNVFYNAKTMTFAITYDITNPWMIGAIASMLDLCSGAIFGFSVLNINGICNSIR